MLVFAQGSNESWIQVPLSSILYPGPGILVHDPGIHHGRWLLDSQRWIQKSNKHRILLNIIEITRLSEIPLAGKPHSVGFGLVYCGMHRRALRGLMDRSHTDSMHMHLWLAHQ